MFLIQKSTSFWEVAIRYPLENERAFNFTETISRLRSKTADEPPGFALFELRDDTIMITTLQPPIGLTAEQSNDSILLTSQIPITVPIESKEFIINQLNKVFDYFAQAIQNSPIRCEVRLRFAGFRKNPFATMFVDRSLIEDTERFSIALPLDASRPSLKIEIQKEEVKIESTNTIDLFAGISGLFSFDLFSSRASQ